MKSQNLTINVSSITMIDTYKNVVDTFGGPEQMAEKFGISISTVYKWTAGKLMSMTLAIRIHVAKPEISLKNLLGYELYCDPIYFRVLDYYRTQSAAAKALGLSQYTVRAWLTGELRISLEKASLLEEITKGEFHPSDFPHLLEG
ncbi:hypothetical protein I6M70_17100 [Acinetobacter pittii]|uniref:hypothetical protein n=1 Tax=Acinetobacter pittii TaxID=48296 RepID=UPI0018FF98AF|nr:hypothetical protein [Acinetobacter pittii]MBJ8481078.1 hypothetical protein [Acinetobacter pittii]